MRSRKNCADRYYQSAGEMRNMETSDIEIDATEVNVGDKKEIRRKILALRDDLSHDERERAKVLLTERILGHQWFYRSDILLGFASYGSEIDTGEILQEALRLGKRVYLPKIVAGAGLDGGETDNRCLEMVFLRVRSLAELQPGYRGIPEPDFQGAEGERTEVFEYQEENNDRTLMLMPGVAFDGYRNRIGYGKGFYDRFLADRPGLQNRTIAVGFLCQMSKEEIACGEHDIKPYQVLCV